MKDSARSGWEGKSGGHDGEIDHVYQDERGKPHFKIVRAESDDGRKRFVAYRRDGSAWRLGLGGARRLLYRLPEIIGSPATAQIFIVEGEKDADRLAGLGLVATTNPFGAGKWGQLDQACLNYLRGHPLVIIPDNDEHGRNHARDIILNVFEMAAEVRHVELPGLPEKGDVSDFLDAGSTVADLLRLVDSTPPIDLASYQATCTDAMPTSIDDDGAHSGPEESKQERKGQATQLVELAEDLEYFHTAGSRPEAFVTLPIENHREHWPVRSTEFRQHLLYQFWRSYKKAPNREALQTAIGTLESRANFEGEEHSVFVRIAGTKDTLYIDLVDAQWGVIKVTASGWNVVADSPVRFRRSASMAPLAEPARGGSIEELRPFVNLADVQEWRLFVGYLIGCFHPDGPYPVAVFNGEHGSAKSTACRVVRLLVDPCDAPLRTPPSSEQDLVIATRRARMLVFDNLSKIPDWLSDAICRLSTGGGLGKRMLYTDDEEWLTNAKIPVVVNGIDDLISRGDLLDRSIRFMCPTIPHEKRMSERGFWDRFTELLPRILGAIMDGLVAALANRRAVSAELSDLPRMADWAIWVTAAEAGLGWTPGTILDAYRRMLGDAVGLALEASPIVDPLLTVLQTSGEAWTGTATKLLGDLMKGAGIENNARLPSGWPKSPSSLANALRRLAPHLREVGVEVEFERSNDRSRTRLIHIRNVTQTAVRSVHPSANGPGLQETEGYRGRDTDGGVAENPFGRPNENGLFGRRSPTADDADDADGEIQLDSGARRFVDRVLSAFPGMKVVKISARPEMDEDCEPGYEIE